MDIFNYSQEDNQLVDEFAKLKEDLKQAVIKNSYLEYYRLLVDFINKIRKAKSLPYVQLKNLLIYLSAIAPELVIFIQKEYLSIDIPLINYCLPE